MIKTFNQFINETTANWPPLASPVPASSLTFNLTNPSLAAASHTSILSGVEKHGLINPAQASLLKQNISAPNFLGQLSQTLIANGEKPSLITQGTTAKDSTELSAKFSVQLPGDKELAFDLGPAYLGAEMPFLKDTTLNVGYRPGELESPNQATFNLGLRIPIKSR